MQEQCIIYARSGFRTPDTTKKKILIERPLGKQLDQKKKKRPLDVRLLEWRIGRELFFLQQNINSLKCIFGPRTKKIYN